MTADVEDFEAMARTMEDRIRHARTPREREGAIACLVELEYAELAWGLGLVRPFEAHARAAVGWLAKSESEEQ
jgi:hypothetical protein